VGLLALAGYTDDLGYRIRLDGGGLVCPDAGGDLGITHIDMSSSEGIERDGLHRGIPAPTWSLPASSGRDVRSPPSSGLQLILFADHSLVSFPSVVDGLKSLRREAPELEIVLLLQTQNTIAAPALRLLGLDGISVVTGSSSLYGRYNMRAMPWLMFVDSSGRVRCSSIVNHAWQIDKLWRLARVPLAEATVPRGGHLWWWRAWAGV
jgi:hypothetical protein